MTRDIERALHDIADSASALSGIAEGGVNQRPSALLAGRIRRRRAFKAARLAIVGVGTATGIAFAGLPGAVLSTTSADNAGIILAQTSSSGTSSASGTSTASSPTGTPTAKGDRDVDDPKTWPTPPPECQSFFDAWKIWWAAKDTDHKAWPTAWPTDKPTAWPTDKPTAWPTARPTAWPTAWPTDKPTATPSDRPTPSAACSAALKALWDARFEPVTISPECKAYLATWKDLFPMVSPIDKPTSWHDAWPTNKPTFTIDPKVKAWIDNMPAACKTFFPFGKFNDPKADQTMPKAPEVKPSWAPAAPAPMSRAFGNKWPTTSMPTAPAGTGGSNTRTQWQGGTFPSSPGWGR